MRLFLRGPTGELSQPRAARAAGRIQVAHCHVIEQYIVKPPGAQLATHEMRVRIEHGYLR